MSPQEFCNHLDELFEVDSGTIQSSDNLQEAPGWDSLKFLGLIALVDSEYEIALTPKEVLSSKTVGDLYDCVKSHSANAAA